MTKQYQGSCHCGSVRYEVALDLSSPANRCNCSACTKTGVTSMLVKPDAFVLIAGADHTGVYVWGGKISRRYFCRYCGIHCYAPGHLAEVGGDYVSINLNTIDGLDLATLPLQHWDGRHNNWESGPRSTPWPITR